jgi:hypothetical protein
MANYWGAPGAIAAGANPAALYVGDSWFWYPLDNLVVEIAAGFPGRDFVVVGRNGAEAGEWATKGRKEIEHAFKFYASGVQALVLSGGGNDVAGSADFLRIVADDCSGATTAGECYRAGQPDALIAALSAAYAGVILKFRAHNDGAPVFLHNYDHAWPTGQGLFGPADWLKAPMDKAKVPKALRRELFKDLMQRLRAAQLALARNKAAYGKVVAIASAGTLPEDASWWANELHPTPAGFKRLAQKAFVPALKKAIVA